MSDEIDFVGGPRDGDKRPATMVGRYYEFAMPRKVQRIGPYGEPYWGFAIAVYERKGNEAVYVGER